MQSVKLEHVAQSSFAHFNFPSSTTKEMFNYVDSLGHFYCQETYHVERQYYNSYLLIYVKAGSGYAYFNGRKYLLEPDSVYLINGRLPHAYGSEPLMEIYWLHFDGQGIDKIYQYILQQFGPVIKSALLQTVLSPLIELVEGYKLDPDFPEPIASYIIHRILAELVVAAQKSSSANITHNRQCQRVIRYIESHFSENLSIHDLAEYAKLSPYHFTRVFKEDTGYTPIEFLNGYRINQAKMMLKTTSLSVRDIAKKCGFQSTSYFSTCFKKRTGATPHVFRKSLL